MGIHTSSPADRGETSAGAVSFVQVSLAIVSRSTVTSLRLSVLAKYCWRGVSPLISSQVAPYTQGLSIHPVLGIMVMMGLTLLPPNTKARSSQGTLTYAPAATLRLTPSSTMFLHAPGFSSGAGSCSYISFAIAQCVTSGISMESVSSIRPP